MLFLTSFDITVKVSSNNPDACLDHCGVTFGHHGTPQRVLCWVVHALIEGSYLLIPRAGQRVGGRQVKLHRECRVRNMPGSKSSNSTPTSQMPGPIIAELARTRT